jgi:hypothetical protein
MVCGFDMDLAIFVHSDVFVAQLELRDKAEIPRSRTKQSRTHLVWDQCHRPRLRHLRPHVVVVHSKVCPYTRPEPEVVIQVRDQIIVADLAPLGEGCSNRSRSLRTK